MIYIKNTYLKCGIRRKELIKNMVSFAILLSSLLVVIYALCSPKANTTIIMLIVLVSFAISVMLFYRPNKRLILNDSGLLLLNGNSRLNAMHLPWCCILKMQYRARFLSYTSSAWSYELEVICKDMKNKDAFEVNKDTITINLGDFLSEFDLLKIRLFLEYNKCHFIKTNFKLFSLLSDTLLKVRNKHPKTKYTYEIKWF